MRTPRTADPRVCSIDSALKIIGEKWALLALREITFGFGRFDDIAHNTGAPRDILTARLKSLQANGVLRKEPYQERPVRYQYLLTDAGLQLFGILDAIRDWGDRFARSDIENVVRFTHECGSTLKPEVCCSACKEVLRPGTATPERGIRRSDLPSLSAELD